MSVKKLIPCLYMLDCQAVTGWGQKNLFEDGDLLRLVRHYSDSGADELLVFDFSSTDQEHEAAIGKLKEICGVSEVPVIAGGNVKRLEDVKKLIYAGCAAALLNFSKESNVELLEEASKRFGKEKLWVSISEPGEYLDNQLLIETYAGGILLLENIQRELEGKTDLPVCLHTNHGDGEAVKALLSQAVISAVSGAWISDTSHRLMEFKQECKEAQIAVSSFESSLPWEEFKLNDQGLLPVIVQDYKTDQVLMLAYMNQESFAATLRTGRMTYWSRSRQELWMKGETSGHFQYVKSLTIDCDRDTLLARVSQIGPACHTGNQSCFYTELVKKEYDDTNPLRVFEDVYGVIMDRKEHPKEGSYTNYLFDKGIDKILKKVGEECTEIVIAAKNPDKEEIKYEISDFLYHIMVLMAEKGVTWEDITRELAHR